MSNFLIKAADVKILLLNMLIPDDLFLQEFGKDPVLIWTPVIEDDFGQKRFLTDHPIQIISSGQFTKVPVLTGVTTDEFANRAFGIRKKFFESTIILMYINIHPQMSLQTKQF